MKNLLIGLLMLVTTNLFANPALLLQDDLKVIVPDPPSFPITESIACVKDKLYAISKSKAHVTVETIYEYNKLLKVWVPRTCKKA